MKRNYGIDLLRLILMLMVVVLHILGHGGVLDSTDLLSARYNTVWLLESTCLCAVNCYAIITGYVHGSGKFKFSSLFQLILQTSIYSIGISLCVWLLKPNHFSLNNLIYFLFPVSHKAYWYISAYVGLFVLIPLLNSSIRSLSKKQSKNLLIILFVVFSVIPTFGSSDPFLLNSGYSTLWLSILYILGSCIRLHGFFREITFSKALFFYICSVLFSWSTRVILGTITFPLLGEAIFVFDFNSYISPSMVTAALFLFLAFKNLTVTPRISRWVSILSPAAFGVYLIHEHEHFRGYFISERFSSLTTLPIPLMIAAVLMIAVVIFSTCLLIDLIRCKVFKMLHVKERFEKLEHRFSQCDFTSPSHQ